MACLFRGQCGSVEDNGDEIVIVYRCSPDRESAPDSEIAQIFRTIDFNARQ
jgi:hypothetical protein